MRIALVHDYLNEAGGAERVLRVLADMYPTAPIYTAFVKNGSAKMRFGDREIRESSWGWLLKIGRIYSYLRFCLPWIWKSVDLRKYDIIITSCSGYVARGFRVRDDARVIAYCHTPPRWLYGYDTPTGAQQTWWGKFFMWIVGPFIRYFDFISAQRVDRWIANSKEVAGRIKKFYRKDATVVYPPAYIKASAGKLIKKGDYYLIVSRIVGGKGIEAAIAGARRAGIKLKIAGEVVGETELGGAEYVGQVDDQRLGEIYAGARGFIALARDEDFGMTLVEAMSCGTPVLAYNGGGYKETVVDPAHRRISKSANQRISQPVNQNILQTGILIDGTDAKSVARGIGQMEKTKWEREEIVKWAKRFGRSRFERGIRRVVGA